jgi:hypothetical protein
MPKQPIKKPLKNQKTQKATPRSKVVPIKPKFDFEGLMLTLVVMTLVLILVCTWFVDLSDGLIDPSNHVLYTTLVTALGSVIFLQHKANKDSPPST